MAIEFACPTCGSTLRVDDDAAGRDIRCGKCLVVLRVPDDQPDAAPADPPLAHAAPAEPPRERTKYDPERRPARRRPPPPPRGAARCSGSRSSSAGCSWER